VGGGCIGVRGSKNASVGSRERWAFLIHWAALDDEAMTRAGVGN
jgi:hypothetical protein